MDVKLGCWRQNPMAIDPYNQIADVIINGTISPEWTVTNYGGPGWWLSVCRKGMTVAVADWGDLGKVAAIIAAHGAEMALATIRDDEPTGTAYIVYHDGEMATTFFMVDDSMPGIVRNHVCRFRDEGVMVTITRANNVSDQIER